MTAPPDARQTLPTLARPVRRSLQRACACKGRDDCPTCRGRRAQRSAEGGTAPRPADMPRPASLETGGRPLGAALRSQVEPLFGTAFHDVRVHDDAASHGHASALDAQAFTWGQHVHFGAGRYQPHTRYGLHLLAHELAHTIQQRGSVAQAAADSLDIDAPDSPAERAADAHADAVVADRATPVGAAPAGSGIARRLQRRWDRPRAGDCADVPEDRFQFIGNGSVQGAKMALLSRQALAEAESIASKMTYIELSSDPKFMNEYTSTLFIPGTDIIT